eukprot:2697614-Pleurochrysis_carterae.AAC.1
MRFSSKEVIQAITLSLPPAIFACSVLMPVGYVVVFRSARCKCLSFATNLRADMPELQEDGDLAGIEGDEGGEEDDESVEESVDGSDSDSDSEDDLFHMSQPAKGFVPPSDGEDEDDGGIGDMSGQIALPPDEGQLEEPEADGEEGDAESELVQEWPDDGEDVGADDHPVAAVDMNESMACESDSLEACDAEDAGCGGDRKAMEDLREEAMVDEAEGDGAADGDDRQAGLQPEQSVEREARSPECVLDVDSQGPRAD